MFGMSAEYLHKIRIFNFQR